MVEIKHFSTIFVTCTASTKKQKAMRTAITSLLLVLLLLFVAVGCKFDEKQNINSIESIHLKVVGGIPDTLYIDPLLDCAEMQLHLRCSVEHSNLWSNLQFWEALMHDTLFNYSAVARLHYEGDDGNGIMVVDDTVVIVRYTLTQDQKADVDASQRLYFNIMSPDNNTTATTLLVRSATTELAQ